MNESIIIGLLRNIAILLTFSMLYDHFWVQYEKSKSIFIKVGAGIVLGGIGIVLFFTPWTFVPGIFFDTRSVMLSVSGLFFGPIPTIVAMIIVGLFRLFLGGHGVWMGVTVVLTSGTIGILWRYFRPNWQDKNDFIELASLGILVHVIMLCCTILLPIEHRWMTFQSIFFPVLFIYPIATVLLGKQMISQYKNRKNKQALDVSEERWHFALEGTGDGVWDWNLKTNEVYFSKQWKLMLGYNEDEIENKYEEWEKRVHLDDKEMVNVLVNKAINGETPIYEAEYRFLCKDGSYKWILDSGKIMSFDENGKAKRFIGTHKDVSERKERELQLAHEHYLVEALMNYTPESIYFKDLDSRFIRINNASSKNFGFSNPTLAIGMSDFDFFSKEYATKTFNDEQEIIRTGTPLIEEEKGIWLDGTETWGLSNKMPLHNPEGDIIGTFGILINITERKIAEQEIRLNSNRLKTLVDLLQMPADTIDAYVHNAINKALELTESKIGFIYKYDQDKDKFSLYSRSHELDLESNELESELMNHYNAIDFWNEIVQERKPVVANDFQTLYMDNQNSNGGTITRYLALPILRGNQLLGVIAVANKKYDYTESDILQLNIFFDVVWKVIDRKIAEEELINSETRYRHLFEQNPFPVLVYDLESLKLLAVNDAFIAHYGYTNSEALELQLTDLYPESERLALTELCKTLHGLAYVGEWHHLKKDGTQIVIEARSHDLTYNNRPSRVAVISDITKRKLAEDALKESEHYTNSILSAIPDLMFVLDENGVYLDFKTGSAEDLAMPKEMFIGKSVFDILPNPIGKQIIESIHLVLKKKKANSIEYELLIDEKVRIFECFILPFGDFKVIAMVRNITKRKKVEHALRNSQNQLKKFAAHLQDVREEERVLLAREIHDELGQILIALKIDLGMLKQSVIRKAKQSDKEDTLSEFDQVFSLLDKTIKTTRKIMTGLRPEVLEMIGFTEAARLYAIEFEERHHVKCMFENTISNLKINSQQSVALFRILQEALTNVAKHAKATTVMINLSFQDEKIIMEIVDNGVGLDGNQKIKHDSYGLIGMRERVFLLDGELTVSGQLGEGTCVLVEMPFSE